MQQASYRCSFCAQSTTQSRDTELRRVADGRRSDKTDGDRPACRNTTKTGSWNRLETAAHGYDGCHWRRRRCACRRSMFQPAYWAGAGPPRAVVAVLRRMCWRRGNHWLTSVPESRTWVSFYGPMATRPKPTQNMSWLDPTVDRVTTVKKQSIRQTLRQNWSGKWKLRVDLQGIGGILHCCVCCNFTSLIMTVMIWCSFIIFYSFASNVTPKFSILNYITVLIKFVFLHNITYLLLRRINAIKLKRMIGWYSRMKMWNIKCKTQQNMSLSVAKRHLLTNDCLYSL